MITLTRITTPNSESYLFAEQLITTSFPQDEYRPLDEQRHITAGEPRFHLMQASDEGRPIGIISFWELDGICYVEHFATLEQERSKGYGCEIMRQLQAIKQQIVLEVEEPTDELTRRRINFYERQGFTLCPTPYTQPPYRKGGNSVPMLLMFHGSLPTNDIFEKTRKEIYKNIYGIKEI